MREIRVSFQLPVVGMEQVPVVLETATSAMGSPHWQTRMAATFGIQSFWHRHAPNLDFQAPLWFLAYIAPAILLALRHMTLSAGETLQHLSAGSLTPVVNNEPEWIGNLWP